MILFFNWSLIPEIKGISPRNRKGLQVENINIGDKCPFFDTTLLSSSPSLSAIERECPEAESRRYSFRIFSGSLP